MARRGLAVAVLAAWFVGCAHAAHEAGQEATKGAISTLTGQEPAEGGERPKAPEAAGAEAVGAEGVAAAPAAAQIGGGVAAGIVKRLARPGSLEDLDAIASRAGAAFARGFTGELAAQVGDHGAGPFGAALAAAGEQVSAGAVRGASSQLGTAFPECSGPDQGACIRRQLEAMARAGATGAIRAAGPWPYLLAAATGAALALLVVAALGGARAIGAARRLEVRRSTP